MSEIKSQSHAETLSREEREAKRNRERALEQGNSEELAAAERMLETTEEVREGFRKAGVSLSSFRSLSENTSSSEVALGAYEMKPDVVGRMGMASPEDFLMTDSRQSISDHVKATIDHEKRHRTSHQHALQRGEHGLIRAQLGEEVEHDLQEAMASRGTTEGFDAYDRERSRASAFASNIGSTRSELEDLLLEGKEAEIVERASQYTSFR